MPDTPTQLISPTNLDLLGKVRTKYGLPSPTMQKSDVDLLGKVKKEAMSQQSYKKGGHVKDWHGFGKTATGKHKHGF